MATQTTEQKLSPERNFKDVFVGPYHLDVDKGQKGEVP
jgi:hypothetical protein